MPLSEFQRRVAEIVFALAEAEGFALAGGGALIAHDVVDRTTRDLDCFGPSRDAVDRCWPAIRDALTRAGLAVNVHVANHGFAKLTVNTEHRRNGFDPARRNGAGVGRQSAGGRCVPSRHQRRGTRPSRGWLAASTETGNLPPRS
jgi:hypothetical protein